MRIIVCENYDELSVKTAKVFVWNEANKITPAAKSETVQIVRE